MKSSPARAFALALLAWIVVFVAALRWGAAPGIDFDLVTELRLPRAILASAVGAGLAVSGAVLQALFSNPLADPYTIGIASGAAIGTVIGATLGTQFVFAGMAGLAFGGALFFALLLYGISRRPGVGSATLLLSGVMLQFLGSSLVAIWIAFADPNGVQGALVWLLGDLSRARLEGATAVLAGVCALSFFLWTRWRELDALLTSEEGALALGVDVTRVRRRLIFIVSMLVAACVSGAGMIGFVGLVVPHFVRRRASSLHFTLLPLCALWGAIGLTASDLIARVAARPYELPVGVVTALIGAPIFLWIVVRKGADA